MAATANLSGSLLAQYTDGENGTDSSSQKIAVSELLPQDAGDGVTIRGITIQTIATAGGAAVVAIAGGASGSTATLLSSATQAVASAASIVASLTATTANLQLDRTDIIEITRSGANSQNRITFEFGEYAPVAIAIT